VIASSGRTPPMSITDLKHFPDPRDAIGPAGGPARAMAQFPFTLDLGIGLRGRKV
jgi:hypothetical protein